jgi:hypothetical protein
MIELKVKVFRPDGSTRVISDYLLEQRAEKLRHAAEATLVPHHACWIARRPFICVAKFKEGFDNTHVLAAVLGSTPHDARNSRTSIGVHWSIAA